MKKVVIYIAVLVIGVFLAGCLDYKAYELDNKSSSDGEQELVDEIAAIEAELYNDSSTEAALDEETAETTEEETEVVLPELTEEPTPEEKEMQVINVKENEMAKLKLNVADPDKDQVTYTFSPPFNSRGEWKTNYGDAGEYLVTLKATDGKLTTEKTIKVVVQKVNVPPIIEGIRNIQIKEGETVNFNPRVSDPNNDQVKVSIAEPLTEGTWVTDHTSAGEYQIAVIANDGELETEKTFTLIVTDVNQPPVISGLSDLTIKEGETAKLQPQVTDLDEDEVTLTISDPLGNDGIWETTPIDHGVYSIIVAATDGKDKTTKTIQLTVEDVNMPPVFNSVTVEVS